MLKTLVPVMSEGIRSGVNWMRLKPAPMIRAMRFDHQSLRRSGHALDERVSFGEEADQDLVDDRVLADDDFLRFTADVRGDLADVLGHAILMAVVPFSGLKTAFCDARNYTERATPQAIGRLICRLASDKRILFAHA